MIVLDSSAALDYLLRTENGDFVADRLEREGLALAPHLLDAEVVSGLRRIVASRVASEERAVVALSHLASLRIARFPLDRYVARVWELRHHVTVGDAFFVALAEESDVPLLTTDRRLARSHGHRAEIVAP